MTKSELDTLLKGLSIAVAEGEGSDGSTFPRINYWEFVWALQSASGGVYGCIVTYQISFFSLKPRHAKLIELIQALAAVGVIVTVQHETVLIPSRMVHSFFTVDVIEDLI